MKCIKTIKKTNSREIGEIIRIEEKEAESKVKTGFWSYCPKSEWKSYTGRGRGKKTDQVTDQATDQVPTKRGKKSNEK
jgi:hypothetical protein